MELNTELLKNVEPDRHLLESVFSKIPGTIYIHDLVNDVNLYRSRILLKVLGYANSPMLKTGKGIRGLVHKEDLWKFKDAGLRIREHTGSEPVAFTYRMKHKNGKWLWFQSEEYVYERDEKGNPTVILGYATNLTETIERQQFLKQWNNSNEFLLQTARILARSDRDYRETLSELAKAISLHFDVVCDISILNEQTEIIIPEAVYHHNKEITEVLRSVFNSRVVKEGQGLVGSVIAKGEEIFINNVSDKMKAGPRSVDERIAPTALIYRPLTGATRTLGSLNLTRLEGELPFSEQEIEQIRQLANHVSLFVENALLHEIRKQEVERRKRTESRLERMTTVLKKNEDDTMNMLNTIPIYIARVTRDLQFIFVNDEFRNAGVNPRSIEGKNLKEFMGEKHLKNLAPYFKQVISGERITFEYDSVMPDGIHHYFSVSMVPDLSESGEVTDFYVSATDVTAKVAQEQKLRESEERLRLIFDNVEEFIGTVNEDGIYETMNRTAQGLTVADVVGTSIYSYYPNQKKADLLRSRFAQLKKTGRPFVMEDEYTGPDGTTESYTGKFIPIFRNKKFYKAIVIIRDVTAERSEERAVMEAVIKGQEQERKRLGAELHDGVGQILSAISLDVSQIKTTPNSSKEKRITAELDKLDIKVQTAIKEVRTISHGLMPEVLESFGLKEAIRQLCNGLSSNTEMNVMFDHFDLEDRYPPTIELSLYRIAQELLNNIQKHASPSNVFVNLIDHGETINLSVEDDGMGFEFKTETSGIGLKNVASRVKMLGGEIDIESANNRGSLINIEVPKHQK